MGIFSKSVHCIDIGRLSLESRTQVDNLILKKIIKIDPKDLLITNILAYLHNFFLIILELFFSNLFFSYILAMKVEKSIKICVKILSFFFSMSIAFESLGQFR